jgi:hypothetical protein
MARSRGAADGADHDEGEHGARDETRNEEVFHTSPFDFDIVTPVFPQLREEKRNGPARERAGPLRPIVSPIG